MKSIPDFQEPENGVQTHPMDVNTGEFKELQRIIAEKAAALSDKEKLELELYAIQVKIEDYLNDDEAPALSTGDFLRLYIEKLGAQTKSISQVCGTRSHKFQ